LADAGLASTWLRLLERSLRASGPPQIVGAA
jgi:hypothetical protein